jgi:peptide deformylase
VDVEGDRAELLQHEIDHLDGVLSVDRPHGLDPFCLREEWHRLYGPDGRYGPPDDRNTSYATPLTGLL